MLLALLNCSHKNFCTEGSFFSQDSKPKSVSPRLGITAMAGNQSIYG